MKANRHLSVLGFLTLAFVLTEGISIAEEVATSAKPGYALIACDVDTSEITKFNAAGEPVWVYSGVRPIDAWPMPDGSVLTAYLPSARTGNKGGVRLIGLDKRTVFDYPYNDEIMSCQPMANGHILVNECDAGRITEIDCQGKALRSFDLLTKGLGHKTARLIRLTPQNTVLVGECYSHKLREYELTGHLLKEWDLPMAYSASRLANGNTLISGYKPARVVEIDPADKSVWTLSPEDLPAELNIGSFCESTRLSNGNTLVACASRSSKPGPRVVFLEVSPEKHVVWKKMEVSRTREVTALKPMPTPFFCAEKPACAELPADRFYPYGRRMPFMGYSGVPARDLTNGFTVAGPSYGDDRPYVKLCASNGWPVVAHISHGVSFTNKDPAKNYVLDESSLRASVAAEVRELAPLKVIVWWALLPEELRCWRKNEMRYLEIVCEAIRANDPLQRPIYHYNPNHRDAGGLAPIAKWVDVVGKGCYVNLSGKKRDRAWVAWSIEQEESALRTTGRPLAIPIVMPELCKDPEPGEEKEIRDWVRHDVYLGLAKGAKGLCLWSLFKRKEVGKTWHLWYDAYAECGRELNGRLGLAQVFLFGGEPSAKLAVKMMKGAATTAVKLGGTMESGTTSEQERRERDRQMASWTARELVYNGDHWLFLISSSNAPATFEVVGWPADACADNAFTLEPIALSGASPLRLDLPAYGVVAVRFTAK